MELDEAPSSVLVVGAGVSGLAAAAEVSKACPTTLIDRLPVVGDETVVEGLTITVLEMDAQRIARVRLARGAPAASASPPSAAGAPEGPA